MGHRPERLTQKPRLSLVRPALSRKLSHFREKRLEIGGLLGGRIEPGLQIAILGRCLIGLLGFYREKLIQFDARTCKLGADARAFASPL